MELKTNVCVIWIIGAVCADSNNVKITFANYMLPQPCPQPYLCNTWESPTCKDHKDGSFCPNSTFLCSHVLLPRGPSSEETVIILFLFFFSIQSQLKKSLLLLNILVKLCIGCTSDFVFAVISLVSN